MRKKILIVEDNSEVLELQRLMLREAGYATVTASNGIEALKKARTTAPDLILLDLVLPELDGFAVCESLRQDPATASLPIIVLTGLTSEFTKFAGIEAGANDYVTKPASLPQLVSKIQYWLERSPLPAERAAMPRGTSPRAPFPRPAGRAD